MICYDTLANRPLAKQLVGEITSYPSDWFRKKYDIYCVLFCKTRVVEPSGEGWHNQRVSHFAVEKPYRRSDYGIAFNELHCRGAKQR